MNVRLSRLIIAAALVSPGVAHAQGERSVPLRPVHTFSIVARDPATGELGVAVQSHWFSVGPAQAAGGDIRGRQSAALIVVTGKPTGKPWVDRTFDLRVDDHAEPLKELRRLVVLQRAYNHMNAGDLAVERKDNQGALREYSAAAALARLLPNDQTVVDRIVKAAN
jgi:uncharacterized Ntn-hydrolase superfamily protein